MLHNEQLVFFAKYIESEIGIIYSEHNYFQLENRIEQIARYMGLQSAEQVYDLAQKGIREPLKQLLLDVATNNETSFFRDPKVFNAIEKLLLEKVNSTQLPSVRLKIWSAAASTGQEALSLSLLISELNQKNGKKIDFDIIATDISERVLKKAKAGRYTQLEVQRGVPIQLMVKYFKKEVNDEWVVSSDLLKRIQYRHLNLNQMETFNEVFDIVLCRNILIYQSVENKKIILNKIAQRTKENGYLILGSGESILGLSDQFNQSILDQAVIYKKKSILVKAA